MSVFEKLMVIQSELKAPKSQYNSFGKYNYRNCEDILEALKPHLAKHKAVVFLSDDIEYIEGRYYVRARAIFIDVETGERIEVFANAREEDSKKGMDGSQITGASSSYARKYALNGLFAIDDTKDADTTNNGDNSGNKNNNQKPTNNTKGSAKAENKGSQAETGELTEKTKNNINNGIKKYKELTGADTTVVLEKIEKQLGYTVADITLEAQGKAVVKLLAKMVNDYTTEGATA